MRTITDNDGVTWTLRQQPPSWRIGNERGQIAGGVTLECTSKNEGKSVYISVPDMPLAAIKEEVLIELIAVAKADTD